MIGVGIDETRRIQVDFITAPQYTTHKSYGNMLLRSFAPVRIVTLKQNVGHRFLRFCRLSAGSTRRSFPSYQYDLLKKKEELSSVLPKGEKFNRGYLDINNVENIHFHGVMECLERYQDSILNRKVIMAELCDPGNFDIEAIMNIEDWNALTDLELVEFFREVVSYDLSRTGTIAHYEPSLRAVRDTVEGRLSTLSIENLLVVGKLFILWSTTSEEENFRGFAKALGAASKDTITNHSHNLRLALQVADLWYWSRFGDRSKWLKSIVFNLLPKAEQPQHILQLFFYLHIIRNLPSHFKVHSLEKMVLSLEPVSSLDELAFAALGIYKSNSTLQNIDLMKALIKRLEKEASTVHEFTLNAVCKVVCSSVIPGSKKTFINVQKIMMLRAEELSLTSLKSLLLLGSHSAALHSDFVIVVYKRVLKNLTTLRMKDLSLFMDVFTSYTYDGIDVKILAERVNEVIHEPTKTDLLQKNHYYHTILIHYIMFSGVWPLDLIVNLLRSVHHGNLKSFPRSILSIDILMEVFYPNLKEVRLSPEFRKIVFESLFADRIKLSLHPSSFTSIEITKWVKFFKSAVTNGENVLMQTHIIPTCLTDLVLCVDKTGLPVSIPDELLQYEPWELKKIPNSLHSSGKKLIAIMFVGKDARKNSLPRHQREKIMILKRLGYYVYVIQLAEFVVKDKRECLASFTQFIQSLTNNIPPACV